VKEEIIQQLELMLKKSRQSIELAEDIFNKDYFDDAAAKAYYAVFHALQAILLSIRISFFQTCSGYWGF